jgi:hypothetical protein
MSISIRWILVVIAALVVVDCGSNDNSKEGCETGYVEKEICTTCGPTGGCGKVETKCALSCSESTECAPPFLCFDGVCQVGGCI